MVEVKSTICRMSIPSFCGCVGNGNIDATVTCTVGIPLSSLTIGAAAIFSPCGTPASFGYRAFIGKQVRPRNPNSLPNPATLSLNRQKKKKFTGEAPPLFT